MSFPDLEYRSAPLADIDADAVVVALPPVDGDAAPSLDALPGLK